MAREKKGPLLQWKTRGDNRHIASVFGFQYEISKKPDGTFALERWTIEERWEMGTRTSLARAKNAAFSNVRRELRQQSAIIKFLLD